MVMAAPESRLSSSAFGPQITSYFLYFAAPVPLRGPEKAAGPRHWSHNPTSQQLVSQTKNHSNFPIDFLLFNTLA